MRKFLIPLLMASAAATPAVAAQRSASDREAARAERAEAREQRRAERQEQRASQPQRQVQARSVERVEAPRPEPSRAVTREVRREAIEQRREALELRRGDRQAARSGGDSLPTTVEQRRSAADSVREWRGAEREQNRAERVGSRGPKIVTPPPRGARPDVKAPLPATARSSQGARSWHGSWRRDGRYDWRRHRDRNRSLFRLGFYFDPWGWSYRRHSIGWRLWPIYYRSSYWLDDPWMYRLPPAYGPYRWVRYWDDALLVNIYTGEVVDVVHDFFW